MAGRQPPDLDQGRLGALPRAPSTGYDLKQEFATTPLGVYQPSSGALYPALRRLERRGLLRAEPGQPGDHAGARRRYVYQITEQGREAHVAWVRQPVDPATIARDLPLHMMRFVMMEPLLPRAEVLAFLADLRDALAGRINGAVWYAAAAPFEDRHSPLALDHGIATFTARPAR